MSDLPGDAGEAHSANAVRGTLDRITQINYEYEADGKLALVTACTHFRVIYTRRARGGKIIRSRVCRHCGKRGITYERVAF